MFQIFDVDTQQSAQATNRALDLLFSSDDEAINEFCGIEENEDIVLGSVFDF